MSADLPRLLSDRRLVVAVAVVSAALAATGDAAPTGTDAVDAVLRAGLGGATALAGHKARRAAWVVALALVTVGASGARSLAGLAALAAVGLATSGAAPGESRRLRLVGALVGALVANAGLRLRWPTELGATAALAGLACAVLWVSGWRRSRRRTRRLVLRGALGLAGAAVVAAGAGLAALALASDDADRALDAGVAGIEAARAGESDLAIASFEDAQRLLGEVRGGLGRWFVAPARAVPVLAQHLEALDVALAAADDLARSGAELTRGVHIDRIRPVGGRVDIDALAGFVEPLARSEALLEDVVDDLARIDHDWLLPPLRERVDDVTLRVADARGDNRAALDAARAVPALLGRGGERRWFLAVLTPAELRGGGGFMGSWGILTATDGALELPVFERLAALYAGVPFALDVDPAWNERYLERFQLARFPQNAFSSPHFPSSAAAVRQIAEQAGYGRVDGVIAVDPDALAALLELTGPVTVAGWPEPLTAENAAEVLLHGQYVDAPADRPDFLEDTARTVFDRLLAGDLPAPATIADVLGPLVAEERIKIATFDDAGAGYLGAIGVTGELALPGGDAVGLVTHNAAASKLDWFLRRRLTYALEVDRATGAATGTVAVTLENTAPAGRFLGDYFETALGRNVVRQLVSLYSVLEVTSATVDGEPVTPEHSVERGRNVADVFVTVPPGGEVTLRFEVAGAVPLTAGRYSLRVDRQPTVAPDEVTVVVNGERLHDGPHTETLTLDARR